MGRRNRLSRGLIGILAVTVALGLVFYFHNTSKSKAQEKSKPISSAQTSTAAKATANPISSSVMNPGTPPLLEISPHRKKKEA